MTVLERFLKYISIDTTSDSSKKDTPSTEGQKELARKLVEELLDIGVMNIYYESEHGYLYAKILGNEALPSIGFVAHLDTSESASGKNINPMIVENYDGKDITLNEFTVLSPEKYPDLKNHIGKSVITTDGTTLLGADDKAGIAEIMQMLENIINSNEKHGDIFVCFTPDEEIGLGTLHLDYKHFSPDIAYTIDGSSLGEISYENFNAATAKITIKGIATHTGSAKGKMVNAVKIATIINSLMPEDAPENTEDREGFYHLKSLDGNVSSATIEYLIRDFDLEKFNERKKYITKVVDLLNKQYNNCINIEITDSYKNMYDVIKQEQELINITNQAMKEVGIAPEISLIRGGTDGVEISYNGIPCPNIGTGGHNFHSIYEYIAVEDMEKVVELLTHLVKKYSKEGKKIKLETKK